MRPRKPPPGLIAAAEQDYHAIRDDLAASVRAVRLLAAAWSEVEVFAEVYYALGQVNPRAARAMGAAAMLQIALGRADTLPPTTAPRSPGPVP